MGRERAREGRHGEGKKKGQDERERLRDRDIVR